MNKPNKVQIQSLEKVVLPVENSAETDLFGADISSQPGMKKRSYTIDVNSRFGFQKVRGIGGTFSEQMADCYQVMSDDNKKQLMQLLFDNRFNFCRTPIGADDFALEWYSYNETKDDFVMANFSIERDLQYIIPVIHDAQQVAGDLAVHASPWSPPSWMKDNQAYASGAILDQDDIFAAYAKYLRLFVESYREQNISVERLIVQNEPDVNTIYPSCHFLPKAMARFITDFLAPEFANSSLKPELFAGSFRCIRSNVAINFLTENEQLVDSIDGIAMQYTASQPLVDIRYRYGDELKLMHTESNCFNGDNSWEEARYLYENIIDMFNGGMDNYSYWNMVLDQEGTSTWGWKQNSMITYDKDTDKLTLNPDFYIMDLFAKFVKTGYQRVSYHSLKNKGISFVDEEGNVIVIVANFSDENEERGLNVDGQLFEIILDPHTIEVFKIS
ncbi:glycoside hydrolase family 30 protein [Enterococcus diestrammenae]|uniref:glycoside hydrolase family 30 protein n=1 Tax=Enterococcus diestrammenae TaxID=1155073 RepID=UPI00195A0CBB